MDVTTPREGLVQPVGWNELLLKLGCGQYIDIVDSCPIVAGSVVGFGLAAAAGGFGNAAQCVV